ncbi:MAG: NAD(P)H-binding protein [Microlunatus sp.]
MTQLILVTGGTGTLGRPVVDRLLQSGSEVRVASRRAGPNRDLPYQWAQVDYRSDASTQAALTGANVVVHCANSARRVMDDRVVKAAVRAGVEHFVYISIVGIDRIPFRYYRNKLATERQLATSGMPYTILRATQFHDLAYQLVAALTKPWVAPLPKGWRVQPVEVDEVADRLAVLARMPSAGGRVSDFGGPEVRTLPELAGSYRNAIGRPPRRVLPFPFPGATSAALRSGANLTPEHADGQITFEQYLTALRS